MSKIFAGLAFVLGLAIGGAAAGVPDVAKTAKAYIAAYERLDPAALEPMYTEDAVFTDPTSYGQPGFEEGFTFKGRAAVLAGIKSFQAKFGLLRLKYGVTQSFASPNQVVMIGTVTSVVKGPKGEQAARYAIVTILTVSNGRISEHRDYVDYGGGKPVKLGD